MFFYPILGLGNFDNIQPVVSTRCGCDSSVKGSCCNLRLQMVNKIILRSLDPEVSTVKDGLTN